MHIFTRRINKPLLNKDEDAAEQPLGWKKPADLEEVSAK